MGQPSISVVIPCYNQGDYLKETLASILSQQDGSLEIIVVNDGSTDNTDAVTKDFADKITTIHQTNKGAAEARNVGMRASTCELVHVLDSDDLVRPGFYQAIQKAANDHLEIDVFISDRDYIDAEGKQTGSSRTGKIKSDPLHRLMRRNIGEPCCFVVRRKAYDQAGEYKAVYCADWDMWMRIAAKGCRFLPVHEAKAVYRQHAAGMSADLAKMWETSRSVLSANSAHHPNCKECRKAYGSGRLYLDYACVSGFLYTRGWRSLRWKERLLIIKILFLDPWCVVVLAAKHIGRTLKNSRKRKKPEG